MGLMKGKRSTLCGVFFEDWTLDFAHCFSRHISSLKVPNSIRKHGRHVTIKSIDIMIFAIKQIYTMDSVFPPAILIFSNSISLVC